MAYFIYLAIVLIITAISSYVVPKERRLFFTVLSFGSLAVFLLLQNKIGYDYESYQRIFTSIAATPWGQVFVIDLSVEPGFVLVNKLFSVFSTDAALFFRFFLCLTIFVFALSAHRNYKLQPLCFIIFIAFAMSSLTAIRQVMAVAIVFWGYKYVQRRKFIPYLIVVLVAMSFHITAILGLLMYPLYSNHVTKHSTLYRVLTFIFIAAVIIFKEQFVEICHIIVMKIDSRYVKYFNTSDFAINMVIILVGLITIMSLFLNRNDNRDKRAINIMFVCLAIQSCSAISPMAGRFMMYFYPFLPMCLERIFIEDKVYDANGAVLPRKCLIRSSSGEAQVRKVIFYAFLIFYFWYTYARTMPYFI